MKMPNWLKSLFGMNPASTEVPRAEIPVGGVRPEDMPDDDEMAREVMARCINSGAIVFGNRDGDGKVTITEFKKDDK